jgi:dienelactone hydrolase
MRNLWFCFIFWVFVLGIVSMGSAEPKIESKVVEYRAQGAVMKGTLVYDDAVKGKQAGVLVVPEWWGLNDYARRRARMLAELGYTALAVDMYGDGKQASIPDEAGKLSGEVMKNFDTVGVARFTAALDFLKRQPTVDPGRIAAIGYCFGGSVVLNMAGQGADLRGVVSFHGGLGSVKPARAGEVKAKVLVLTGAADNFVPPEQVETFKQQMKAAGADFRVVEYSGATHSFTNPDADATGKKFNMPIAYSAEADTKSWDEMKAFLAGILSR